MESNVVMYLLSVALTIFNLIYMRFHYYRSIHYNAWRRVRYPLWQWFLIAVIGFIPFFGIVVETMFFFSLVINMGLDSSYSWDPYHKTLLGKVIKALKKEY